MNSIDLLSIFLLPSFILFFGCWIDKGRLRERSRDIRIAGSPSRGLEFTVGLELEGKGRKGLILIEKEGSIIPSVS